MFSLLKAFPKVPNLFLNNQNRILKRTQTFWCPPSAEYMFPMIAIGN